MQDAVFKDETDRIEVQQQLLAWQTALLMNATGNYKKAVKPEMLLGREKTEEVKSENKELDREVKNKKLDELREKFQTT